MAIAKRSTSTLAHTDMSAGPASVSINKPTGAASGDVCYIGIATGAAATSTANGQTKVLATPSGWTLIGAKSTYISSQSFASNISVYRRVLDGSEGSTITFSNTVVTGSFAFAEGYAIDLTGVDTTTPEDGVTPTGTDGVTSAGDGKITVWPTLTTTTANDWLLAFESLWDACSFTTPTGTNPATYAFEYDGGGTSSSNGTGLLGVWTGTRTTAGATGQVSRSNNGNAASPVTNSSWSSLLVAVKPSSGAAATSMLPINPMQQQLNQLLAR